jgi:hypothetical protein
LADLSGAASATLTFQYEAVTNEYADQLEVRVSPDGGSSWHTLETFAGSSSGSRSYDISSFISDRTGIMFVVVNRYGAYSDLFYADDVEIAIMP